MEVLVMKMLRYVLNIRIHYTNQLYLFTVLLKDIYCEIANSSVFKQLRIASRKGVKMQLNSSSLWVTVQRRITSNHHSGLKQISFIFLPEQRKMHGRTDKKSLNFFHGN